MHNMNDKMINCYYLENRKQNMCSCRDFARALVFSDQDIINSVLCANLS